MPPIVLLLFMCFSLHACNARHLGFIDKQSGGKPYHSIDQDVGKVLIVSHQTSKSSARPVALVQYHQEPVELKKAGHTSSGHDIITLSSGIDLRKMIYMKGLKRQGRILLGSSTTHEIKEDTDSKEDETVEDVGVMDYAQPHRKPPIHNEKAP